MGANDNAPAAIPHGIHVSQGLLVANIDISLATSAPPNHSQKKLRLPVIANDHS
jgi:hypothetical protein